MLAGDGDGVPLLTHPSPPDGNPGLATEPAHGEVGGIGPPTGVVLTPPE